MGHHSGSDSDSDKERKHDKHSKHDKHDKHDKEGHHKEEKYERERYEGERHESSGSHYGGGSEGAHHIPAEFAGHMPGHENYGGKLRKEDVQDLKHRTDISEEEREHRRKVLMAEVAAGVAGAGVLGWAGYHHFNKDDDDKQH